MLAFFSNYLLAQSFISYHLPLNTKHTNGHKKKQKTEDVYLNCHKPFTTDIKLAETCHKIVRKRQTVIIWQYWYKFTWSTLWQFWDNRTILKCCSKLDDILGQPVQTQLIDGFLICLQLVRFSCVVYKPLRQVLYGFRHNILRF